MVNKKIMINGQPAVLLDMEKAYSLAFFDETVAAYDGSIDIDVKRAVVYNKVVIENLIKRIFSAHMHMEDKEIVKKKQIRLRDGLNEDGGYSKIYYADLETSDLSFLEDVCDDSKNLRSYSEYIIYSLVNHYFDYIKN